MTRRAMAAVAMWGEMAVAVAVAEEARGNGDGRPKSVVSGRYDDR